MMIESLESVSFQLSLFCWQWQPDKAQHSGELASRPCGSAEERRSDKISSDYGFHWPWPTYHGIPKWLALFTRAFKTGQSTKKGNLGRNTFWGRHCFRWSYSFELASVNQSYKKDFSMKNVALVKPICRWNSFVNKWISHYLGHSSRGLVIPWLLCCRGISST